MTQNELPRKRTAQKLKAFSSAPLPCAFNSLNHLFRKQMTICRYAFRWVPVCCLGWSLMACASDSRNQLPAVPPATAITAESMALESLEGFHDISNCNGVMGWAWNQEKPDEPVQVELYDDATLLATITAGDFRQDLLAARIGNGKPHKIRMKFASVDKLLNETPKEIKCAPVTP
jgi:hypothetical protein